MAIGMPQTNYVGDDYKQRPSTEFSGKLYLITLLARISSIPHFPDSFQITPFGHFIYRLVFWAQRQD